MTTELEGRLAAIGLQKDVIKNALQNKKLTERLKTVLDVANLTDCGSKKGRER